MKLFRVCAVLALMGAVSCKNDTTGTISAIPPLAGLRYMNISPDTSAVDFRIVDAVAYAPNQTAAAFRTGGVVDGISLGGATPFYLPVAAGSHEIRVFLNGTTAATASTILLDTTITFLANNNYTFYLYGYANSPTNGVPKMAALVTTDTALTIAAGNFAVRVIHAAPTMAGAAGLATRAVDVWIDTLALAAAPVGAPTFANVDLGQVRASATKTARPAAGAVPALAYRVAFAATGGTAPIISAALPVGVVGTSTTNPTPGVIVSGTQYSVLLVPRSTAATGAPQTAAFTNPTALFLVDQLPPRTAP